MNVGDKNSLVKPRISSDMSRISHFNSHIIRSPDSSEYKRTHLNFQRSLIVII